MSAGTVTTFYSYKGGVGRTLLLANIAWLLARWGRRVLCLDWDLEAPGLHRYLAPNAPARPGVLDLVRALGKVKGTKAQNWRDLRLPVSGPWTAGGALDLIPAGRQDDAYLDQLQSLEWTRMFKNGLSPALEGLREEWVEEYDHVLLDSRTGVTDIQGICASQLPDLLVLAFTASLQSVEGTVQVARRAQAQRDRLPLDRGGFWCIPVPCRLHAGEETLLEREWFARFEKSLGPLYHPWKDRNVEAREYLAHLRVNEIARWSFGEPLPVAEEGIDDASLVSFAFATLAALIDQRLEGSGRLIRNRHEVLTELAGPAGLGAPSAAGSKKIDVFISHNGKDVTSARALADALRRRGVSLFLDVEDLKVGEVLDEALYRARENSRMIAVLLSSAHGLGTHQSIEIEHASRLGNEKQAVVVPILLDQGAALTVPTALRQTFGFFLDDETSWDQIAGRLAAQLRSAL